MDCSAAALDVIRASPEFDARRMRTLHRDASREPVCDEPATFDYVAMVYFLSALDADGRNHAVAEAYRALKPGGELLYTTCSILWEENDRVIEAFLKRTRDAQTAEARLPSVATGGRCSTMRQRKHGGVVFYPSETHQGGYVAVLRKAKGNSL